MLLLQFVEAVRPFASVRALLSAYRVSRWQSEDKVMLSRKANFPKIKGANNIRPGASPEIVIAPGAGQAVDDELDQCVDPPLVSANHNQRSPDHFAT